MITPEFTQLLKDYILPTQTVLILFSPEATADQTSSALALFSCLEKMGKHVTVACPEFTQEKNAPAVGKERIVKEFGNKDLQITFDYVPDRVEKVSYNIDEAAQKFHLIIQPKKGGTPLDTSTVQYSYTGVEADLLVLIGVSELDSLGELYFNNSALFENTALISINTFETEFGTIKVDISDATSFSEGMARVILGIGGDVSGDAATNLLSGIEQATDSFRSLSMTAETFELVSQLLRAGARRFTRPTQSLRLPRRVDVISEKNSFAEALSKKSNTPLSLPGGRSTVLRPESDAQEKPKKKNKNIEPRKRLSADEGGNLL